MVSAKRLKLYNWLRMLIPNIGRIGFLRIGFLRWCGVEIGKGCQIDSTAIISGWGKLCIGDNVTVKDCAMIKLSGNVIKIGNNVVVAENVIIESRQGEGEAGQVIIGNNVDIMMYSIVSANGNAKVTVGNDCKIAHHVSIKATHHKIMPEAVCIGDAIMYDDIVVGDGCWICAGALILPGVKVGIKNVIAAGAVVTKSTPDGVLMAGVPADVKKRYAVQ